MYEPNETVPESAIKAIDDPQLAGESDKAYRAYKAYRSLAPPVRTLRLLANINSAFKMGSLGRWSTVHNWQKRVAVWDKAVQRHLVLTASEHLNKDIQTYLQEELTLATQMREQIRKDFEQSENAGDRYKAVQAYMLVREIFKENYGFYLEETDKQNNS